MQSALFHGAGHASALLIYDRQAGVPASEARNAAAQLLGLCESNALPENLNILVALGPELLADHAPFNETYQQQVGAAFDALGDVPARHHDLLVQVSATTEAHRVLALRVVDACLNADFQLKLEILGGRILNSQEHFGFPDGNPPSATQLAAALHSTGAAVQQSSQAGLGQAIDALRVARVGTWLFYLQIEQNLDAFAQRSVLEQTKVLGRKPAHIPVGTDRAPIEAAVSSPPADSHWARMRPRGEPRRLLRRGFPSRVAGKFGLTFLAACEDPAEFGNALAAMQGDQLKPFVSFLDGSAYFCPPDAAWLAVVTVPAVPKSAISLIAVAEKLTTYEVTESFLVYMDKLIGAGFFEGAVGAMRPAARDVQPALDTIYQALEKRSGETALSLRDAQTNAEDDANAVNTSLGMYLTIS